LQRPREKAGRRCGKGLLAADLADQAGDAIVQIGARYRLRIPRRKLGNDQWYCCTPDLVELLAAWTAANLDHIRRHKRLIANTALLGQIDRAGLASGDEDLQPAR
jgi:hypothetical protein